MNELRLIASIEQKKIPTSVTLYEEQVPRDSNVVSHWAPGVLSNLCLCIMYEINSIPYG